MTCHTDPAKTTTVLPNTGSWTWWTKPRVVRVGTQTLVGSTDEDGKVVVSSITDGGDITTVTLQDLGSRDDHNSPTVVAETGKPLVCLWANHNNDRLLRIRRTNENVTDLGDLTWESIQTVDFGHLIDSYPITVVVGNTLWTFCRMRHGSTDTDYHAWAFVKSTDWGETWSAPQKVWESKWHYLALTQCDDDTTVRAAMCRHPNEGGSPELWYCEIDLTTGDITVPGGVGTLGNLDGTNLPLPMTDLQQAGSVGAGNRQWVFDVGPADANADPVILSAEFDTSDIEGSGYYYATKLDGTWSRNPIVRTGAAFWSNYLGGAQFEQDTGHVWIARESVGAWFVERYVTSDHVKWGAIVHAWNPSHPLRNPWPVVNGTDSRRAVVSQIGTFSMWDDWTADMVVLGTP